MKFVKGDVGRATSALLITKSNVALIGTTDDPADDLSAHFGIREDKNFKTRVVPTFRPDNALGIEKPGFADYIKKLGDVCGYEITSFELLKKALSDRMDFFASAGSKISDHALSPVPYREATDEELEEIFADALNGNVGCEKCIEKYKTALLIFLGGEYAKRDWVMQLHMSAIRNNNSRMFEKLGMGQGFLQWCLLVIAFSVCYIGYMPARYDASASVVKNIVCNGLGLISSAFKWSFIVSMVARYDLLGVVRVIWNREYGSRPMVMFVPLLVGFVVLAVLEAAKKLAKEKME